jgi:transcriptional regulator with XRE-family HTH domain
LHFVPARSLPPFASLLRELRRSAGLTQEQVARKAQVGVRTLRDLETGHAVRPQRSTVDLLAGALGLDDRTRARFIAASRGDGAAGPQGGPDRLGGDGAGGDG